MGWEVTAACRLGHLQGRQATAGVEYLNGTRVNALPEDEESANHDLRNIMSGPNLAEMKQRYPESDARNG